MPIDVVWDNEIPAVIHYHFIGRWSWREFSKGFEQELRLAATLDDQRYDVIGNLLESTPLPPGSGITEVYSIFKSYPPNWGNTVIVTPNAIISQLLKIGTKIYPETRDRFFIARTLEDARATIVENRAGMPNSPD